MRIILSKVVPTILTDIILYFLSQYVLKNEIITGTLMSKIIRYRLLPMKCAFNDIKCYHDDSEDGVVDSILQNQNRSNIP